MGCHVLAKAIDDRPADPDTLERDGQGYRRVAPIRHTIISSLGPVVSLRPRYRCSGVSTSLDPVDESLGLVADYPTGPAAEIGSFMMGECTPRDCVDSLERAGGMRPSVSMLQRLMVRIHETWESIREPVLSGLRVGEGIPATTRSVTVSLDGIMVPLQPRARSHPDAAWREASCGTVRFYDSAGHQLKMLYFGRMPQAGKGDPKAQLVAEVAHIRTLRPDSLIAVPHGTTGPSWRALSRTSRGSITGTPASISRRSRTMPRTRTGPKRIATSCSMIRTISAGSSRRSGLF